MAIERLDTLTCIVVNSVQGGDLTRGYAVSNGDNRILISAVFWTGLADVVSFTYAGKALNFIQFSGQNVLGLDGKKLAVGYMLESDLGTIVGTETIQPTWDTSSHSDSMIAAGSYKGIDQDSPLRNINQAVGSASSVNPLRTDIKEFPGEAVAAFSYNERRAEATWSTPMVEQFERDTAGAQAIEESSGADRLSITGNLVNIACTWDDPGRRLQVSIGLVAERGGKPFYELIADGLAASGQAIPHQDIYGVRITRNIANIFNRFGVGRATAILDNNQNQYTQSLQVNQDVTINAISPQNSTYTLFKGTIEDFAFNPAVGRDELTLRLSDLAQKFRNRINVPLTTDTRVSSATVDVLSITGFSGATADVSAELNDPVPFQYLDDRKAGDSLYDLVQAAGAFAYISGGGVAVFEDRNFDAEATIAASFTTFFSYRAGLSKRRLINKATIASDPRQLATTTTTVAWFDQQTELTSGESLTIFMDHVDPDTREKDTPATAFVTPVASQDYLFTTQESAGGSVVNEALSLQLTHFALTTKAVITNNSQTGYLNYFVLRGKSIKRQAAFSRSEESSSSQNTYGLEELVINNDLVVSPLFAQTYAEAMVSFYNDPPLELRMAVRNQFPEIYQTELLNTVYVQNSQTAVDSLFLVVGLDHDIDFRKGLSHTLTLDLELRIEKGTFLRLGVGRLDVDRLGF